MLFLPATIMTLSGVSGAGGLVLSMKSVADSLEASAINRQTQFQNERNLLRFESVSNKLEESMEQLGQQRMAVSKNFNLFVRLFERIHNRPEFSQSEDASLPQFDFDEIKNVSVVADAFLGAAFGAVGGSSLAAMAASGMTKAIIALGKASTGTKIATLHGAAATKAAMAALGGGALNASGGGIALGTLVLNVASLGVGVLVEGIAMAYSGSIALKQADEAHRQMLDNEVVITDAIELQVRIACDCDRLRVATVNISNDVFKPLARGLKELVERKQDWNSFTVEEKRLVENNILVVQILHFLNNIPIYRVTKVNANGEVEEVEPNRDISSAIRDAKSRSGSIKG